MKILIAEELPSLNKGEVAILMGLLASLSYINGNRPDVMLVSGRLDIDKPRYAKLVHLIPRPYSSTGNPAGRLFTLRFIISSVLIGVFGKAFLFIADRKDRPRWESFLAADMFILGHDNSMSIGISVEVYGLILFAKIRRKQIVFYAGSFGPFTSKIRLFLNRMALNAGDMITVREPVSFSYLKSIGVSNPNLHLTADLAFLLQPAHERIINEVFAKETINMSGRWVGINLNRSLSRLAFNDSLSLTQKYDKYCEIFSRLADDIVKHFGVKVLFIPHVFGPNTGLDDRVILQNIFDKVREKESIAIMKNEYSPDILKGIIGRLDLFIGARTHSMIASTSMGVPTIALSSRHSEHTKTNGIIGTMMGLNEWIIYIEELIYEDLFSKVNDAWTKRREIAKDLLLKTKTIQESAKQNGILLKNILSKHKVI